MGPATVALRLVESCEDETRGVATMAETKRMTVEQVVSYLLEGEGLDFLRESLAWVCQQLMEAEVSEFADGATAIVRGALDAGCTFFAGYPITPASSILAAMLRELPKAGGVAIQGEDEIASIGMCLGNRGQVLEAVNQAYSVPVR